MSLTTAMVLAAGLGTRMRPLTDDRPKALVEVGGRALIDHVLDRLADGGVERAVVNVHWFADRLEEHLASRDRPAISISDERSALLETGGGLKRARPLLGDDPVLVANIDSVWTTETDVSVVQALREAWDEDRMDVLLMLARTDAALGFDGAGDGWREADGRFRFRAAHEAAAPLAYMGLHACKPAIVDDGPDGAWSLTRVWRPLAERGRVHAVVLDGFWMHVGDPDSRRQAERRLAGFDW